MTHDFNKPANQVQGFTKHSLRIDLAAVELQAKRMRRIEAGMSLLRDFLYSVLIGAILCAPIFWQMAVDAGWWKD